MHGLAQVAMCTNDIPRTIRTYVEVLGFSNAGGRPRWGEYVSKVQEFDVGDDASCMMWWLVGEQEFVQIELFHHTSPPQRPRPAQWRPSDLGWVRFGIRLPDFDATLARISAAGLSTMTEPRGEAGARRVCLREPGADTIIELFEAHPEDDADSPAPTSPTLVYAAASVSDLDAARSFFGGALGRAELAGDTLHRPEHEELWGLAGADAARAVFRVGEGLVELVEYRDPAPRPVAADARLSDQGIMNVAFGYRDRDEVVADREAALALGATATMPAAAVSGGMYLRLIDGLSLELLLVPEGMDSAYGFTPEDLAPPGSIYAITR